MFADADVRKAAEPFVRVLVRVPEAYLLLKPYDSSRPGLLVMDANGRRVDALSLSPVLTDELKPAEIAKWLSEALRTPPRERIRFRIEKGAGDAVEKLLGDLREAWKAELVRDGDVVTFDTPRTRLDIDRWSATRVLNRARRSGVEVVIEDPVRVALTVTGPEMTLPELQALLGIAGLRKYSRQESAVFVSELLLHPRAIRDAVPRLALDVEAKLYDFELIPKGAKGASVAAAPLKVKGVLTVFPDVDNDEVTVVMRPGTDDAAIRDQFELGGARPEPPETDEDG